MENPAAGVKWDLSDFYSGPKDPRIEEDFAKLQLLAQSFQERFRGEISSSNLSPELLLEALLVYEEMATIGSRLEIFSELLSIQDATNQEYASLKQRIESQVVQIKNSILFFDIEWVGLENNLAERILADPRLAHYQFFLERKRMIPSLSEPEEKVINLKNQNGFQSFARLHEELVGRLSFPFWLEGKYQKLTLSQIFFLSNHHKERKIRAKATKAFARGLRKQEHLFTFVFNRMLEHWAQEDLLRGFTTPMLRRNIENCLEDKTVETFFEVCRENLVIARDYYNLKRKILGLKRLMSYDLSVQISEDKEVIDFSAVREVITRSYNNFSPETGKIIEMFFERSLIDAESRLGKDHWELYMPGLPGLPPRISVNFQGRLHDVITLGHELGHGLHGFLLSRQGTMAIDCPSVLSETASNFGQMLVTESLLENTAGQKRLAILMESLGEAVFNTFRQIIFITQFELEAHLLFRQKGELNPEEIKALWNKNFRLSCGKSLFLTGKSTGFDWMAVPHFFAPLPFYSYSYVFGYLLTLGLWAKYKKEGKDFVERYLRFLEISGLEKPSTLLLKTMGVDISQPEFWQEGLDQIRKMLEEAERLFKSLSKT